MTLEEAIEIFEQKGWWIAQKETFTSKQAEEIIKLNDAVDFALFALRPVSREQVEKVWRGKWKCHGDCGVTECSICGWNIEEYVGNYNFCPVCGAAQTDEAVEMVMERMKELK